MEQAQKVGEQEKLAEECVRYFKEHSVFKKLFAGFRTKYASYGTFAGIVTLREITNQELEDLEGFFQKNYHGKKSVCISAASFEKALEKSRFAGLAPKMLLEMYFKEKMVSKKEQEKNIAAKWQEVFDAAKSRYAKTPAAEWLTQLQEGREDAGAVILKRSRENENSENMQEVCRLLELGAEIINRLPVWMGQTKSLPVFAAELTGNPHAFDADTKDGHFLYQLVCWADQQKKTGDSNLFPALQKQQQFLAAGLLIDGISNYAIVSGVRAKKRDGSFHAGMDGFLKEGSLLHVPLPVIAQWQQAECPGREIYIVENPSIYALLVSKWKGQRAVMCMNGQPRLSSLLLLDLLAKTDTKVYYSGDFDPEGILIAQKLKQYYKGEFSYWHMSVPEYKKSMSKEGISEKRLKMLERITEKELIDLADEIARKKLAGYQENIWQEFNQT